MWKPILPISGNEPTFGEAFDIRRKCERYDIGRQPLRNRSGLTRRAAVGLLDAHSVPGFGLILHNEFGINLFVDLACWVVGNVEKLAVLVSFDVLGPDQRDPNGSQAEGKDVEPFRCAHDMYVSFETVITQARQANLRFGSSRTVTGTQQVYTINDGIDIFQENTISLRDQ